MKLYSKRVVVASAQDILGILYRDVTLDREKLVVMHLNSKREVVDIECLPFELTTSAGSIFNKALIRRTLAVVLAHGLIECLDRPSETEHTTALKLANVGMLLNIPVEDYLVVGYKTYYSFSEQEQLPAVSWDTGKRRPIWRSYAVSAIG